MSIASARSSSLVARQPIGAATIVPIGLRDPVADRKGVGVHENRGHFTSSVRANALL